MTPPRQNQLVDRLEFLEDLAVRYWDNSLTAAELDQLSELLRNDPKAREQFQLLNTVAIRSGELGDLLPTEPASWNLRAAVESPTDALDFSETREDTKKEPPNRRLVLKYASVGLVAGISGLAMGSWFRQPVQVPTARLIGYYGAVTLGGVRVPQTGSPLHPGSTLATANAESSVLVETAFGSRLQLPGNSTITLGDDGHTWRLTRGHVAAMVPDSVEQSDFQIETDDAIFNVAGPKGRNPELMMLAGRQNQMTDLCVERGNVAVLHPVSGDRMASAQLGDYLTIQSGSAKVTRETRRVVPDRFKLDLSSPLSKRWEAGTRVLTPHGPILAPELRYDRWYGRDMWQVRSDHQWTRGFVRVDENSRIRMCYKVSRPGTVELCLCVRTHFSNQYKHTQGVLGVEIEAENRGPDDWRWVDLPATEFLNHRERPTCAAPWVATLFILNTFEIDLELQVSELEIVRPLLGGRL
jgi:hypothetical protein